MSQFILSKTNGFVKIPIYFHSRSQLFFNSIFLLRSPVESNIYYTKDFPRIYKYQPNSEKQIKGMRKGVE